jgi:hypothetical protein
MNFIDLANTNRNVFSVYTERITMEKEGIRRKKTKRYNNVSFI